MPVAGTIVAGDTSNATLCATAKQCTGTEGHAAIWLLNVTAAGQSLPLSVPLFIDPTTPPLSAFVHFDSALPDSADGERSRSSCWMRS